MKGMGLDGRGHKRVYRKKESWVFHQDLLSSLGIAYSGRDYNKRSEDDNEGLNLKKWRKR